MHGEFVEQRLQQLRKAVLFFIRIQTKFKTGGKKRSRFVFPAKMGLNRGEPSTRNAHALPCLHTQ